MKRVIRILLIGLAFMLPSAVFALSATPSISCSANGLAPSGKTNCTVYVTVNSGGLKGVDATLKVSSGLTVSSLASASGWNGNTNNNRILLYTDTGKTGKVKIATFTITASSSISTSQTISLTNIGYSDENDNDVSGSNISKTINILSNNNSLSSLSLSNGTLSPSFSENNLNYSATIDSDKTVISATAKDATARITGTGTINLKYGSNKYNIVVTSESGSKKTYTITITRPDNRNTDNSLKSLQVSNTNIVFDKNKTSYTAIVDNSVTNIDISATATDSKAKVTGIGKKSLKVGRNSFTITVTAENGSTKKYTINIDRENSNGQVEVDPSTLSKNNFLKSITIDKYNLKFNKNTDTYNIVLDENIDKISIKYSVEDNKATATIDSNGALKSGNNIITITVVAENGSTRKYTLNVRRGNYVSNTEKDILNAINSNDSSNTIKVKIENESDIKEIPFSVLEALKKSNKDLVYVVLRDSEILYSVKISKDDMMYYNYSLSFESEYDKDIKAIVNNKYLPLVIKSGGKTNVNATFTINLKDTNLKDYNEFNLYYYNEKTNELVLVDKNIKSNDGNIELNIDSYHGFVLLPQGFSINKIQSIPYLTIILILIIIVLLIIIFIILVHKKKKNKNTKLSDQSMSVENQTNNPIPNEIITNNQQDTQKNEIIFDN